MKQKPKQKQAELWRLFLASGMTREGFARFIKYSKSTLDAWLAPMDSKSYHGIPDRSLEFVRSKCGELQHGGGQKNGHK